MLPNDRNISRFAQQFFDAYQSCRESGLGITDMKCTRAGRRSSETAKPQLETIGAEI
jgi:hypothetical protein